MKKVLLVGFSSEIGSMLLSLNEPKKQTLKLQQLLQIKLIMTI